MIRLGAPLLRRFRGKTAAYLAYAALMAAAVIGLWAVGEREYQARLERLHHQLGDVSAAVASLVSTSVDHVELLSRQTEALLAEPAVSDSTRRLFAALAPSDAFAGYALDRIPAGLQADQLASLTGSGEVPPLESGAGKEILTAIGLNPLLEATHAQIPEAAWIYYTSKNHFMAIHPWVPSREFHWGEELLTYDFYKGGLPDQNAQRATFWTDIYIDAAGKGLMATVGRPVYDKNGRFRGTIDLDLTLATMSHFLARGEFGHARAWLVNAQNRVIADTASATAPTTLVELANVLPDSALRQEALALDGHPNAFRRYGNWLLYVSPVAGAPWRLLLTVDRRALALEVAQSLWMGFVGILVLAVALIAVEQRRRSASALVDNVAALQRITLNLAAARDEAQQANRAKSMLLANVSHELRTPLNAIIGFSDLMRHHLYGPLGNARYDDYLADIQKSGELLLALINDLLDVTKLEAGRYELAETDCNLAAIIQDVVGLVKMQAERGGVALQVRVDPTLPPVYADERALRQIVLNLLSNAIKFTPSGGSVQVTAALDATRSPTIAVKDTGRGIPHEEMKELFRPFARTAEAKRASTPGTGLGLAIVKSLVELHQGAIAMESHVGVGTTVTVTLPAQRVIAAAMRSIA